MPDPSMCGPAGAAGAIPAASVEQERALFSLRLGRLLAAERDYLRFGRLTESAPGYIEPGTFCRQLLDSLRREHVLGEPGMRARFFAWAEKQKPRSRLLPVLAAEDDLERGQTASARSRAERALSLNQNDLHAQDLYRRAQVDPPPEPDLRGRFCSHPFDNLETSPGGQAYFCCPAWLPVPIGNLEKQSAEEIWNSSVAQDIRRSILDGSYRYCSRMHCPKITGRKLPRSDDLTNLEHRSFVAGRQTRLTRGPKRLALNHDRSCNLSCPSCRTRMIVARKSEQEHLNAMADRVLMPLLERARKVHVTGSGDPFGSAHFRYLLRRIGRRRPTGLRLELQTNGLLLAQSWDELGIDGLVDSLSISIDAVRPETYAVVRRGGDFGRLLDNLAFIADLRAAGRVGRVRLDLVVQTLNFREMPGAVDLVRRFGFDGLKFQMIRSWGTYTPEEFAWHNIGSPDHPCFAELLQVLKDSRLRAGFVEFWGFHSVDVAALQAAEAPATSCA
jgi:MoaA/NifB/PqqE/SkfB family radical SAM enzyme